jgi:DNA modification methylase
MAIERDAAARHANLIAVVADAYVEAADGTLSNTDLYAAVAARTGMTDTELNGRAPVGKSGKPHNLVTRAIRWHQQTLRRVGVLERVPNARGIWALADRSKKDLHHAREGVKLVAFSTALGVAVWGACADVFGGLDCEASALISSPPYPILRPRDYGNPNEASFCDFICRALEPVIKRLRRGGSLCLNLGNDCFIQGTPARSLYRERLVLALCERFNLELLDTFIWVDKSRPPGPIQWASKQRVHLNSTYETIYWLTTDSTCVSSDNRRVLVEHSERHKRLMAAGGEARSGVFANGAYKLKPGSFGNLTPGKIPRNVFEYGHRCADGDQYRADARALDLPLHGALQPVKLLDFLIKFLTKPGELVVDPFGGSGSCALAAERLGRRWMTTDVVLEYLRAGAERFRSCNGFRMAPSMEAWPARRAERPGLS